MCCEGIRSAQNFNKLLIQWKGVFNRKWYHFLSIRQFLVIHQKNKNNKNKISLKKNLLIVQFVWCYNSSDFIKTFPSLRSSIFNSDKSQAFENIKLKEHFWETNLFLLWIKSLWLSFHMNFNLYFKLDSNLIN